MKKSIRKEQHPLDDLFRQGLDDLEVTPSREQRAIFLGEAADLAGKKSLSGWVYAGIGAGLLIIGLVTGLLIWGDHGSTVNVAYTARVQPVQQTVMTNPGQVATTTAPGTGHKAVFMREKAQASEAPAHPVKSLPAPSASVAPVIPGNMDGMQKPSTVIPATPATSTEPLITQAPVETSTPPSITTFTPDAPDQTTEQAEPFPTGNNESRKQVHAVKYTPPKNWDVCLGLYYSPEWMFNTLNGEKFVNNMGVDGTFHFGKYSVRTGLGLSITTGSNEMLVKTNPYVGTYSFLDSVQFNWDAMHYNLIATYYSTNKQVYDTTLLNNYSYIKKRYTYLQIPLILGYDFWQNSRISLGIRGGAVMSLLLKTENLSGSYNAGMDRVISINDISPDRIDLNWQAVAGISASLKLSGRFSLELEPEIRYYFNSVYESSVNTKKPWSAGMRSALLIKL